MMDAEKMSETSVNFNQTTWRNIPENSHFPTRHLEELKFQTDESVGRIKTELHNLCQHTFLGGHKDVVFEKVHLLSRRKSGYIKLNPLKNAM
jgi:hypothetical protein